MRSHFLYYAVEDMKSSIKLFVQTASVFERFNAHVQRVYRESSSRGVTGMQEIVLVMERYQGHRLPTIPTKTGCIQKFVVYRSAFLYVL